MELKKIKVEGKDYLVKIIKIEQNKNIIYFQVNNSIYKAKLLPEESKQIKVYLYNFNKSFTINLGSGQKTSNSEKTDQNKFYSSIKSPLAGRIIKIDVKPNQFVKKNQPLLTIESMKMENEIRASFDAFIKTILISPSDLVEQNQLLITFENKKRNKGEINAGLKNTDESKKISNR